MRVATIILCCAAVVGCVQPVRKDLIPIGGSRADGTVKLAFEFNAFEQPQLDYEQGRQSAKSRCVGWGYTDAEPFGAASQQCLAANQYGCFRTMVTVTYQCTGR